MYFEIEGVLYYEMIYVWQNNNGDYGVDQFFRGMIEGIVDWIWLRVGFFLIGWLFRVCGGNWYDGYIMIVYFFDWIEIMQKLNFVNEMNFKMVDFWSNDFFLQIVGWGVDDFWNDYQNSI